MKYLWIMLLMGSSLCACTGPTRAPQQTSVGIDNSWAGLANAGNEELAKHYTNDATKINAAGRVDTGSIKISNYWINWTTFVKIKNTQKVADIIALPDSSFSYQIHTFQTDKQTNFKQLTIVNQLQQRVLEMTVEGQSDLPIPSSLEAARIEWMRLCNAHNPRDLVETMYMTKAVYYNHRPVIIGTEAIVSEYSYMENPEYQLQLTPLIIEPVNEQMIFEIGQCSGSYGGKYILVWQQQVDQSWKILMDSNI